MIFENLNWVQLRKTEQHQRLLQWHLDFPNGGGVPDTKYGHSVTFPNQNLYLKCYVHKILFFFFFKIDFKKRHNGKVVMGLRLS